MSLYRTLSQMPADIPMTLGRRLPRAYERTSGTMLGRDHIAAFERTDHALPGVTESTASAPAGGSQPAESGGSRSRADAVALPPDEPLPEGWRYGPWIVLADVPPETVVLRLGQHSREAVRGSVSGFARYRSPLDTDLADAINRHLTADYLQRTGCYAVRLLHRVETA